MSKHYKDNRRPEQKKGFMDKEKVLELKYRRKTNWSLIIFMIFILIAGMFIGFMIGVKSMMVGTGDMLGRALKDSNIQFIVNLNETTLANEINKTVVPTMMEGLKR